MHFVVEGVETFQAAYIVPGLQNPFRIRVLKHVEAGIVFSKSSVSECQVENVLKHAGKHAAVR